MVIDIKMNFIGIDLSWRVSPPKPERTAGVVLNEKCELIAGEMLTSDEDIVEFIKRYSKEECIVGIDAPLIVPLKVKQRKCERMLLSCRIAVFPGNRKWFNKAFGGVRGELLVEELKRLNIPLKDSLGPMERTNALFEVYPYSSWRVFLGGKVPKYKNTGRRRKVDGLTTLKKKLLDEAPSIRSKLEVEKEHILNADITKLSGKTLDQLGDTVDALIGAYTVFAYWHYGGEECVVLGNLKEGFILTLANECLKKIASKRKY